MCGAKSLLSGLPILRFSTVSSGLVNEKTKPKSMDKPEIKYTPFQRQLQMLAVLGSIILSIFSGAIGTLFLTYLIFCTRYWIIGLTYILWSCTIDRDTGNRGSRRIQWVSNWSWWKYVKNYYPVQLKRVPFAKFDPKRNYLFCCFPHGILTVSAITIFVTANGFRDVFPDHTPHAISLQWNFYFPIIRDFWHALGVCSSSVTSLNWLLSYPKGGKVAALMIGGASEALDSRPGEYRIYLKKRKGFVKIALKNGAPLVPVIFFGEPDVYSQINNPEGSLMRRFQVWLKNKTGFAPIIFLGRGFFQESFGLIPRRVPLTTVVGKPLDVVKTEDPTQKQIDAFHEEFMEKLTELFEEQKFNYLPHPDKVSLIIE